MRFFTRFVLRRTVIVVVCAVVISVLISTGVRVITGVRSDAITIVLRLILPFLIATPICLFWFASLERLEHAYRKAIRRANELARIASVDPLTGLLNRRSFIEQFDTVSSAGVRGWFILADIDYLKMINDQYGHIVGDDAVIAVAGALVKELPEDSLIARIGGDEFCAFIPKSENIDINQIKERLNKTAGSMFQQKQPSVPHGLALTIGKIVLKPKQSFKEVMSGADENLYRKKKAR